MDTVLIFKIEPVGWDGCGGHDIYVGSSYVGHRPYDGCDTESVLDLISETFAAILRERLGWTGFRED